MKLVQFLELPDKSSSVPHPDSNLPCEGKGSNQVLRFSPGDQRPVPRLDPKRNARFADPSHRTFLRSNMAANDRNPSDAPNCMAEPAPNQPASNRGQLRYLRSSLLWSDLNHLHP